MSTRDRAIAICRSVAADPDYGNGHVAEHAIRLGYDVHLVRGEPGGVMSDYEGSDMDAVELASEAWLRVDPEPLGIESPNDPRRDAAAADMLEKGWTPR